MVLCRSFLQTASPSWLVFSALLLGCGPQQVHIPFHGVVGAAPFACGQSYDGLGTTASRLTPADFRFYLSNIRLVDSSGQEAPITLDQDGTWQKDTVALLDFEDKSGPCSAGTAATNGTVSGSVPAGSYTALRFDLGLPDDIDHQDASVALPPLNVSGLFWSWQSGYKFLRTEGVTTGQKDGYNVHIGSTGCVRDGATGAVTCANKDRAAVELTGFDPDRSVVVADLKPLLAGSDIDTNTDGTAPGCMSEPTDPDCVPIFHALGLAFGATDAWAGRQTFFKVE